MTSSALPQTWTTAPERRFQDHVTKNATWAAEDLRETISKIGFSVLHSSDPNALHFPPLRAYAPKQAAGRKDLHHNRFVEVGMVTRGEMTIWWEGATARCPVGSLFVIPPGIRYLPHVQVTERASTPHSVIWLAVHNSYAVVHMCSLEGNRHLLSEYYSFTNSQLIAQARIITQELAERGPHYQTAVRGSLMLLLTWLMRAPAQPLSQFTSATREQKPTPQKASEQDMPQAADDFSVRVKGYLLSHYHRPLTLTQVARAVGCSPAYLCRRFREQADETPFHFLREVRIEAAKRLLQTDVPVARVAEMVGFDDPLYFSKVFAKATGESPQKFRGRGDAMRAKRSS